uniref:Sphingomyelin synthase-related 1-like n=1 Tax=Saccoglossus kowalevskii TaxID=10224 RepID=A0ABM0MBX7_SACKO
MSFSDMSTNSMGNVRPEQNGGHHISGSSRCDDVSLRIDNDVQEMTEFRPFLNGDVRDDYKPTVIEPEKLKALWSFGYLCLGTYILTIVLTMVHDRMPDSKTHPPLPDIILDNVPRTPWAEDIAEGLITAMGLLLGIVIIFHKHRYIVLRRFFCTTATLYLLRCITIFVTALPETGQNIDCSAK